MKNIYRILTAAAILLLLLVSPAAALAQTPTAEPGKTISGDQIVLANTYRLESGDQLVGNLAVIGGTATLEEGSSMTGDVFLTGGTLTLSGTVNGDFLAIGGAINVEDTAIINGNISLIGATLKRSPLAEVNGEVTEQSPKFFDFNLDNPKGLDLPFTHQKSALEKMLQASLQALATAALAVVLGLLFPQQLKRVAETAGKEPLITAGVGLLTIVIAPIVLVLLTITVILIPITVLAALFLALSVLYGWIAVGQELGQRLAELFKVEWHPSIAAGIGTLILGIVTGFAAMIPCIGWIIGFLVALFGLGAVVISRFGSSKYADKMVKAVVPSASIPGAQGDTDKPSEPQEPKD